MPPRLSIWLFLLYAVTKEEHRLMDVVSADVWLRKCCLRGADTLALALKCIFNQDSLTTSQGELNSSRVNPDPRQL